MRQKQHHATRSIPAPGRGLFGSDGTALAEFALAAPILVTLVLGIADFGMLAAKNAALEGATRVGAEYARNNPTCSQGETFSVSCQCDDGSSITYGTTCVGAGKVPNRVLITIAATQGYTPIISWPGIPTSLTASTEMRVQ